MRPSDIERITYNRQRVVFAQNAVTAISNEVRMPIRERGFDLEERYEAESMSPEARIAAGWMLVARIETLTGHLWSQDDSPHIKPAHSYPHKETKIISAKGFIPLHMTKYHEDGPDSDPLNYPEGYIAITDKNEFWGLHHNDIPRTVGRIDSPQMHACLEDDINTLELVHQALGLTLPE